MAEGELSKRIDDLHKRFDDLRGDMLGRFTAVDKRIDDLRVDVDKRFDDLRADVNRQFTDFRAEVAARLAAVDKRFDDMNQRLTDIHQTLRTFMWVVSGWFTFLTAVLAVFGFLRR
jgi:hypothetical protein